MNKYKRIYEEKSEGEFELVGLIKEGETIKVIKDLSPKQKAILNNKNNLNAYSKKLGGFLHVCYVKNQLLFNDLNLKPSTISRFLYLATYIDYNDREENVLIKHGQNNKIEYLSKKNIRILLNLSDSTFKRFYKEVKDKELLFEANDKIYLNPVYVNKGRSNFRNKDYTRIYIDTTRELYDNCTSRQHKQLSYVYQLLPFLNYESNILCSNPEEKEIEKLNKLSFKDICQILGLSEDKKSMSTLKKDLFKFYITRDDKKYYFFSYVTIKQEKKSESYYVVNPMIIWKGTNLQVARNIIGLLMINL